MFKFDFVSFEGKLLALRFTQEHIGKWNFCLSCNQSADYVYEGAESASTPHHKAQEAHWSAVHSSQNTGSAAKLRLIILKCMKSRESLTPQLRAQTSHLEAHWSADHSSHGAGREAKLKLTILKRWRSSKARLERSIVQKAKAYPRHVSVEPSLGMSSFLVPW